MKPQYYPSVSDYENYYLNQAGYGSIPVYRGVGVQRGYGLGNILASAFRSAMPLFKRGAQFLGRKFLDTGAKVVSDVASGIPLKASLTTRSKTAGKETMLSAAEAVKKMTGSGLKKRSARSRKITRSKAKRRKTSCPSYSDIFS